MTAQIRMRFKPEPRRGADLPTLDVEQREAMRMLPVEIIRGLAALHRQAPPPIYRPHLWPIIKEDALYLATSGFAHEMLALGWHPLEIFGCAASHHGDDNLLGAAGRLDGRVILQATEAALLIRDGTRSTILRRNSGYENTVFLWEYLQ